MYCFWKCDEIRVVELQRDIWKENFYSLSISDIEEGLLFVRSGILYQEINLIFIKVTYVPAEPFGVYLDREYILMHNLNQRWYIFYFYTWNFQKKQMLSVRIRFDNANLSSFIFINRNKCKQTHYRGPYCLRQHKYSNLYYFILLKKMYKIVTFAYFLKIFYIH